MLDHLQFWLILAAALGSFIVSGVFFGFSNFIMKGLARIPEQWGIAAMNSINVTVINPAFMFALFGTAALSLTAIVAAFIGSAPTVWLTTLAGMCYVVGCAVVTMVFNVPRNNALPKVAPETAEATALWQSYLKEWTFWNSVRTTASFVSGVMFVIALTNWTPAV